MNSAVSNFCKLVLEKSNNLNYKFYKENKSGEK